jgi:prepilin-type N-terminal cleavage/methylation domain-containing protein
MGYKKFKKMKKNNFFKNKSGFTLIEILVAVSIFAIIVGVITTSFISAIRSQKRILAYQELFDQISYVKEYMSRTLRMAVKERESSPPNQCLSRAGLNYESDCIELFTPSCVKFKRLFVVEKIGEQPTSTYCETFYLRDFQINDKIETEGRVYYDLPLTSSYLKVTNFGINLMGGEEPPQDYLQPRVTFVIDIETKLEPPIKFKLQTTVSQRSFDVDEVH